MAFHDYYIYKTKSRIPFAESAQCRKVELNTQGGYGTIFSLVTHGFYAEAIIRLKEKYQERLPFEWNFW